MKLKSIFAAGILLTTFQGSLNATAQCSCSYNTSPGSSVLAGEVGVDCVNTLDGCNPTQSKFNDACNNAYGQQNWAWNDANCGKCNDSVWNCGWGKKKGH